MERLTAAGNATAALQSGSRDVLVEALAAHASTKTGFDYREILMGFAPFFDCARRLDLDTVTVFDDAAQRVPPDVAELMRTFGRRVDVTLGAFGWRLEEPANAEPFYRFVLRGAPT